MSRFVPYLLAVLMVVGIGLAAGAATAALTPVETEPEEVLDCNQEVDVADDDVIVTSDYSNLTSGPIRGRMGRERKDGSRGRARMSIEIVSEPLVHQFDEVQLGHGPAQAAAGVVAEKMRGITETVSESTLYTRGRQELAYQRGEAWAKKRFGGPRLGEKPPRANEARKFNHSGTFADGIVATENKTDKTWTINVAANRLDPRTSRNAGEFAFITDALRRLVPELDDPARLMADPRVRAAIDDAADMLVLNAAKLNQQLRSQLWMARLSLGGAIRLPPGVSWGVQRVVL